MPRFARITRIIAFLRSEIPAEDISANPVVIHPHNSSRVIPERLPPAKIKELSVLEPGRALAATAEEWLGIAAAIALSAYFWHPLVYAIAVIFIGSRQHALLIMGHDASHYRYLPTRWQNELFSNLFLMWPTFASVEGFRKFHSTHHQYTNLPDDGNRHIWSPRRRRRACAGLAVSQDAHRSCASPAPPRRVPHRPVLDPARAGRLDAHPLAGMDARR